MEQPLTLYNSLTHRVEPFIPLHDHVVHMFVCGPTVYDYIHIGNARPFTFFDVVAKWLRYSGYSVTYIQNITDLDDKIIKRASEQNRDPLEYAREFEEKFLSDTKALGNDAVSLYARATDYIPQIIAQVKTLIATGHVYLIDGDGWYFDLTTFPDYGKLSGRTGLAADDAVSRIDDSEKKRNTGDFCVWKLSKPGEPVWESVELGAGRPGWHIEDTAITETELGSQYDIHGGGIDLKFPHHEAEIAQQESASGKVPFVKYWMHSGFLENKSEKMSKSLGNFATLHELLEMYEPAVLRFYLLSNHYRAPLDFSESALNAAQAAVDRIGELARKTLDTVFPTETAIAQITEAMNDDCNTAKAFGALFECIRSANKEHAVPAQTFFDFIQTIFGIIPQTHREVPDDVQRIINDRQRAREEKDFVTADRLRDELLTHGYTIDDTPYGPLVKKK